MKQSGEPLEGNIFYADLDERYVDQPPEIGLAPARRNAWRAVRFKERLLEVGVNAGHSALLALSSNPRLEYYGVDIMSHAYTAECVDFLKGEFPGRVHLFTGDSREVLPWLVGRRAELAFDIFHVDGGHTDEVCRSDMGNCIRIAGGERGRHVLLDDVHASWIFDIYCEFVSRGRFDDRDVLRRLGGRRPQRAGEDRVSSGRRVRIRVLLAWTAQPFRLRVPQLISSSGRKPARLHL